MRDNLFKFSIPDPGSKEIIADWAELFIAFTQEELSKAQLSSHIEQSSGEEPTESFVDSVWQQLIFRATIYGDNSPLNVNDYTVKSTVEWNVYPEYMACLIFSLVGNPQDSARSGKLFERITSEAMKNFLKGESIVYGFPRRTNLRDVCTALQEKFNCDPPRQRRDRDLDVVAWRPFGDLRASQIIILMQCASGHDWKTKLKDLNLDAWCRYIHFACRPIKGFSFPGIITNSSQPSLEEASLDAGLILDRVRLYRNLASSSDNRLKEDLRNWCKRRLREINKY